MLALRGTAIPRSQGACDHVLFLEQDPATKDSDSTELPLSQISNLATDPRFTSRPYCQLGDSSQFYAGVPIRTRRGIGIGTYCVMSTVQPARWDDRCAQRLKDISQAMMEHFDAQRCSYESRQHERMNRGLGSFIEGRGTLGGWQSGANVNAFQDDGQQEGALNSQQQHHENQDETQKMFEGRWQPIGSSHNSNMAQSISLREPPVDSSPQPSGEVSATTYQATERPISITAPPSISGDEADRVFHKAANVIRESFEVEGCVFLDVTLGSRKQWRRSDSMGVGGAKVTTEASYASSSSSDEQSFFDPSEARDAPSGIIGFSATDASSIDGPRANSGIIGIMPGWFLAKLLKRHPKGHIFNFDAIGELQSGDSSEDDTYPSGVNSSKITKAPENNSSRLSQITQKTKEQRRLKEGALIHQAFPSARSVAFVPVWDSRRERWIAGGFLYTNVPTRVFSVHGELSFFVAFSKLIAAEVLSLETLQADKAKSDTLGSLSHEMRSPLHGAILSTDLLNDTDLSVFQGNATHTIETCCRTLLDTIEHLLDYAKVNSFATEEKQSRGSRQRVSRKTSAPNHQFGKKSLYRLTGLDRLAEEVVESVYAGFSFRNMSSAQLSAQSPSAEAFTAARRALDGIVDAENFTQTERNLFLGNVSVYVAIEPGDWMFHAQPGALRRIVLNLVGNALKYTTSGTIRVSLSQQKAARPSSERLVKLTVTDTGKGISEDYLRNKLFQPFAQEDELMSGTGLGLSLVKKTVSQLRGKVAVASRVGAGTTVTVTLPLQQESRASLTPHELSDEDQEFEEQVRELAGLRIAISGFDKQWGDKGYESIKDICSQWLRMEVVNDEEKIPDIVIRSEDTIPESLEKICQHEKYPNVIVCHHAPSAWELSNEFEHVDQRRILEFMSQP